MGVLVERFPLAALYGQSTSRKQAPATPSRLLRLAVQDLVGLPQRLDLLLPARLAFLVADVDLHAVWLQVLVVRVGLVQLILRGGAVLLEVRLLELFLILLQ